MKIMFYINTLGYGGAERVLSNIANQFALNFKEVECVFVTSTKLEDEYTLNDKVKRIVLCDEQERNFLKRNFIIISKLRHEIKKMQPDVVISFMAEPNIRMLTATLRLNVKKIISIRSDPAREYSNWVYKVASKFLFNKADGLVFQTNDAKSYFSEKIQCKSIIISNQVEKKFYDTEHENESYYVALGRLAPEKNYEMMFEGFKLFLNENPNEHLNVYGQGNKVPYQQMIQKLEITENVHIMGITDEVPNVLKNAKAFILTSNYEGMPNALLEAMAVGIPCICTDCPCGGPHMIIKNMENGILIPVGEKYALCESLNLINSDDSLRRKLGNNAKKEAYKNTPDKVFNSWKEYIYKIAGIENN